MAGGVSTWQHSTEKLSSPRARACRSTTAVGGVVVSKPMAKDTTWRSGCRRASSSASAAEYTMRTLPAPSPAAALALSSDRPPEAGMRTVSA